VYIEEKYLRIDPGLKRGLRFVREPIGLSAPTIQPKTWNGLEANRGRVETYRKSVRQSF
jgi:hypothetical protein